VIVHNFYVPRSGIRPEEADSELVVDADRVLPDAIAAQRFQPIARRRREIAKLSRIVEHSQLADRAPQEVRRKSLG